MIKVSYNPYRLELTIINEKDDFTDLLPEVQNALGLQNAKTFQHFVTHLPGALYAIVNEPFDLEFVGLQHDYDDLQHVVEQFNRQKNTDLIRLNHIPVTESEERLEKLKLLFNKIQNGPLESLRTKHVKENFEHVLNSESKIAVIATMSSGKSTLVNAMLGTDLMPTKNEAATATITKIYHENREQYRARTFNTDGNLLHDWEEANLDLLEAYNDDEEVSVTELVGPLRLQPEQGVKVVLVDTPGPNNSQDPSHKKATFDFIKGNDKPMVLYVLNATQLGINDDAHLLASIQREIAKEGIQGHDRFIFAVNKIDEIDPEKESVEQVLNNVRKYLENNGIQNPRIFPVTARAAQELRQASNGEDLGRRVQRRLADYEFLGEDYELQKHAPLMPTERQELERRYREAATQSYDEYVYDTGVPALELAIESYFKKYALPDQVRKALSTFESLVKAEEAKQSLQAELKQTGEEAEKLEESIREIISLIKEAESLNKDFVQSGAEEIEEKYLKKFLEQSVSIQDPLTDLNEELNKLSMEESSQNVIEVDVAKRWLDDFKISYQFIEAETQSIIDVLLEQALIDFGEKMLAEYIDRIQTIIGEEAGEELKDYLLGEAKSIQVEYKKSDFLLGHETFLEEYSKTETIVTGTTFVKTSTWWKPWTWGDGYTREDTEVIEVIEYQLLDEEYYQPAKQALQELMQSFDNVLKGELESTQSEILNTFEKLDEAIQLKSKQLVDEQEGLNETLKMQEEMKDLYKWLDEVDQNMQSISLL